jgi:two-component system, NtrC family, nitrogen regulation sensor histidine kinase NtrY
LNIKSSIYFILAIILLLVGALSAYVGSRVETQTRIASVLSENLHNELERVQEDFHRLNEMSSSSDIARSEWSYPIFVFKNRQLIKWTDNKFVPSADQLPDTSEHKLLNTGSETYLLVTHKLKDQSTACAAIDLLKNYPINNDYLSSSYNEKILPSGNVSLLDPSSTLGTPVCVGDQCYFRISFIPKDFQVNQKYNKISVVLISCGLLLLIFALFRMKWPRRKYPEVTFCYLVFILLAIRLAMTYYAFPRNLIHTDLFDPKFFASSSFNASLGDLLLNLICALVLGVFAFRAYAYFHFHQLKNSSTFSWALSIFCVLGLLFAGLFPIVVIQTLYNNSTVSLEIAEVMELNPLRMAAFLCVIISGVVAFIFSHIFLRTLASMRGVARLSVSIVIASIIFVAINEWTGQIYQATLVFVILYVVIVHRLKLHKSLKGLSFNTFGYLFIAILFLSVNGAYSIQHFSKKKKIENQFRFAGNFLIDRDYFGEFLLHELSQKIVEDKFIQTRIASPFLGKEAIKQKIRQVLLPNYFNKYDVEIFIFNAPGDPIDNRTQTFSEYISAYDKEAYRTDYERIRFINNPASDVTQRYLIICPIRRLSHNAGYIVIELSLKKVIPENVYPELLVDYRFQDFYKTRDLSYALFVNGQVGSSSGDFNYETLFEKRLLGNTELYTHGLTANGYDHIAMEDESGRIAVVSSKQVPFVQKLGNFSLLLVLGLFTILLLIFFFGIYQYFRGSRLFFSARIQLYLNLAFFIPLIIVSVSTLSLTSRSSQQQLNEEYLSKSRIFSEQMTNYVQDDSLSPSASTSILTSRLTELAKISNLDANIYSRQGKLIGTSQPLIFERNLLSHYINPRAYARVKDGEMLFIESENVGTLNYYVSYAVLKSSQTGAVLGILGIPFFQSVNLLNKVQSVVLINILNIFALIFIILLLLSYVVAERLTFPLRFITESLRKTSLNNNTPLTWTAHDEIGMMVKEYNSMLYKLSESKSELEHTQREKAWREIAQQVAHEIKNPLTPMKLTLQQLERSIQSGNSTSEKTQRAISTVLAQIDTLNDIASSFSGFVKMPEPVIQRVDLVSSLKHVIDLHSLSGEIVFRNPFKEAWVMGDAQLLSRTFSNVVLNGIQAAKPGHPVKIQIAIELHNSSYKVIFSDNGKGVPPHVVDRIFLPHFSTKKSGSGLGLAIAKQAIEQMKGRIWFQTEEGKGTTFFIELPAAE